MVGTVRDATALSKMGIPNASVITTQFWDVYQVMAGRTDISWLPALELPYPMQGRTDEDLVQKAKYTLDELVELWEGRAREDFRWEES